MTLRSTIRQIAYGGGVLTTTFMLTACNAEPRVDIGRPLAEQPVSIMTTTDAPLVDSKRIQHQNLPTNVQRIGDGLFRAECPNFATMAVPQSTLDLCWAAAASMMIRYRGGNVPQQTIAGDLGAERASFTKICMAICFDTTYFQNVIQRTRRMIHESAGRVEPPFHAPYHAMTSDDLIDDLARDVPVLIGFDDEGERHVGIVYAATFRFCNPEDAVVFTDLSSGRLTKVFSRYAIESIDIIDPLPYRGRVTMTGDELHDRIHIMTSTPRAEQALRDGRANWENARRSGSWQQPRRQTYGPGRSTQRPTKRPSQPPQRRR